MRERDWLVQQGLAKPGRGRLSKAAKEALAKAKAEGMTFDGKPSPTAEKPKTLSKETAVKIFGEAKVREESVIWAIDRGRNAAQLDLVIAFQSCAGCHKPIQYCKHETPKLPSWVDSDVYLTKPEV